MQEAVEREGGAWASEHLAKFGKLTVSSIVLKVALAYSHRMNSHWKARLLMRLRIQNWRIWENVGHRKA